MIAMNTKPFFTAAAALLLLISFSAPAEDFNRLQVSVRGAISGTPLTAQNYFKADYNYNYDNRLANYYGDYYGPSYTCGAITLGVDVRILKWMSVGLDINVTPIWHDKFHKNDIKAYRETGTALTFLPMAKFYYFRRPSVMLYGRAGIGFGKYINYSRLKYDYRDDNGRRIFVDKSFKPEIQLVPFGIELGKKVFWYAEIGFGTVYIGGQTGIGYRF